MIYERLKIKVNKKTNLMIKLTKPRLAIIPHTLLDSLTSIQD